MVDKDEDYLSPFIKKMSELSSVEGEIASDSFNIKVNDIDLFLSELQISDEKLGYILAMTDMYAAEFNILNNGFELIWNTPTSYRLNNID